MLTAGALLFSLVRSAGMLYLTSLAVLGCLGYTFGRMQLVIFQMKGASTPPEGNFCLELPNALLSQVKVQPLGWGIMIGGAVLLFLAGIFISVASRRRRSY